MNNWQYNKYAIIVAGGRGVRTGSPLPKQFIEIGGKPVLMHTLESFYNFSNDIPIILALPGDYMDFWSSLCRKHGFDVPVRIVPGGKSRFESVRNGLRSLDGDGLVAIHDGVRPFINNEIIAASFNLAAVHGSAIAAVRLKESIRLLDKDSTRAIDRSRFRLIQTPQTFRLSWIKKAYEIEEDETMTDDASVLERAGYKISLFEGSYSNIKITTSEDIWLAEQYLSQSSKR